LKKFLIPAGWLLFWLIGPAMFLLAEHGSGLSGFPLDDAWIHQTYARALADGQGWTYAGGAPSAGSTSPLWTVLQVPAYWLRIPPVVWSSLVGVLLLLATATLIMLWIRKLDRMASRFALFFCLGEWHLVWAALSGMETLFYCAWTALVFYLLFPAESTREGNKPELIRVLGLGLIAGLGIWIRPEAVLLSGIAFLAILFQWRPSIPLKTGGFLLGLATPVLLFFAFTWRLNGRLLPNTFYVKTTEYAALTATSLLTRLLQPWLPLLAGPLAVLILFLPAALYFTIRERGWVGGLPLLWALGHLALYAVQLPATYQHGRYFLPILPVLTGYGAFGFYRVMKRSNANMAARILSRAIGASALLLVPIFLTIGAGQFVRDVGIIEAEMVSVAKWIRDHTPPDTVVAAHDIGALGFFGGRRILDLGGVTDLEAIPLLSGAESLREYLSRRDADLLMSMPDFYPGVLEGCIPIPEFQAGLPVDGSEGRRTFLFRVPNECIP
jgi:hypothetical protein